MNLKLLFDDPRPELKDTAIWKRLFRILPQTMDKPMELHLHLYVIRSMGTAIRSTHLETKLVPLQKGEGGYWEEGEFETIVVPFLRPYAAEIRKLLDIAVSAGQE